MLRNQLKSKNLIKSIFFRMATLSTTPTQPQLSMDEQRKAIIIQPPADVPHTATVIGPIHGLGDSSRGWLDGAMQMYMNVPHCKFILPDAPVQPVTLNNGYEMPSWYDITGLGDRFEEDCKGIEESRTRINALIEEELSNGIPADRIVICGFSQGGALSLITGLQCNHSLAGCLVLSGYLAGAPTFKLNDAAKKTPVLHLHGKIDPMVRVEWARETQKRVVECGHPNYILKEYDGLEHSVNNEEMADAVAFLKRCLPKI